VNNINDYKPIIEKIYMESSQAVYKYLYCLSNNKEIAEELTQETFCTAMKYIDKYSGRYKIIVWLCSIARHVYYMQCKKKRFEMICIDENIQANDMVEEQVIYNEEKELMNKEIQKLDNQTRQLMYLKIEADLTFKDIAQILGKTESWVRVQYYRAKQKLINGLDDTQDDFSRLDNNFIIYTTEDGEVKIDVRLEDENVWLTQSAMAKLFNTTRNNITMHIKNIFEEEELKENLVSKESLLTAKDGKNYNTKFYNLDLIIAIGYRVKSIRSTQFRIWANKLIKEYLIKGYNIDSDRFKNNGGGVYFEELLEKIRDIRSSEKVFWRKILDIYATSVDYDANNELTKEFFKTVQNKMHYATHGNTAAEVIYNRVDSNKENIGLTNFKGDIPTRSETEIAKNYLTEEELKILNRMVSAYLDVAEINALSMHTMTMKDWINELDTFLKMTRKDILNHKGKISHEEALEKAHKEYDKYMQNKLTQVEKDYLKILGQDIKNQNSK
jgi:RNA polymerase sigma factor (sigma-70 family)